MNEHRAKWNESMDKLRIGIGAVYTPEELLAIDAELTVLETVRTDAARLAGLVLIQLDSRAPVSLSPERHDEIERLARKLAAPETPTTQVFTLEGSAAQTGEPDAAHWTPQATQRKDGVE